MTPLLAAVIVAAAILIAVRMSLTAPARSAPDLELRILSAFAPGLAAAQTDPRALLVWVPLARAARTLYPEAFAALDRACGRTFPFSDAEIEAAHGGWTADWLAWEQAHAIEYEAKAAVLQAAVRDLEPAIARTRVEALEREKLDRYQRKYAEYVKVSKAIQQLRSAAPAPPAASI